MHLINDGVTVNGDTATVEFAGSGPTTSFQCNLDGQGFSPCELVQVTLMQMLAKWGVGVLSFKVNVYTVTQSFIPHTVVL